MYEQDGNFHLSANDVDIARRAATNADDDKTLEMLDKKRVLDRKATRDLMLLINDHLINEPRLVITIDEPRTLPHSTQESFRIASARAILHTYEEATGENLTPQSAE